MAGTQTSVHSTTHKNRGIPDSGSPPLKRRTVFHYAEIVPVQGYSDKIATNFPTRLQIPPVHHRLDKSKAGENKTARLAIVAMLCHSRDKLLKPYTPVLNNTSGRNMTVKEERRGNLLKPLVAQLRSPGVLSDANLAQPLGHRSASMMGRSTRLHINNDAAVMSARISQSLNALQQIEPVGKGIVTKALSTKTNEVSKAPKRNNLENSCRIVRIWMALNKPASIRAGKPTLDL